MRIVIDMQGAQASNRQRGIGRYSYAFAKSLIRNCGDHEVFILLNGCLEDTVLPLREDFSSLLPKERIHVWYASGPLNWSGQMNFWRRSVAEMTREAAISSLNPSVVVVTSMFEGLSDDAVTSVGSLPGSPATVAILYDLIPALNPERYLENPVVALWYEDKLRHVRNADMLLAISESSRQEAITHLGCDKLKVINVSTDADPQFSLQNISSSSESKLRGKYRLKRPFVMYTGGIDHRKNIEGLVRAWSLLPRTQRELHQLAIICSIQTEDLERIQSLAYQHGLLADDIVFTGFVPEEDLVNLYNICKLFVFPSWHEGFGLPALEAMRCGKAVLAADSSSLPEVVGRSDALFDPLNDSAICDKIKQVLVDDSFRAELEKHSLTQSKLFSWDKTAKAAIQSLEKLHESSVLLCKEDSYNKRNKPKLAYFSPLPPAKSGISDYSAALLEELIKFYEIDLIVHQPQLSLPSSLSKLPIRSLDWFDLNSNNFDRIIYNFGNSPFHSHMFAMLTKHPGVVVLHDFYLSGVVGHLDIYHGYENFWAKALYESHGYNALAERFNAGDPDRITWVYPSNYEVIKEALGVIVHSEHSRDLAAQWYGHNKFDNWRVIPLLRKPINAYDQAKKEARSELKIEENQFVVCCFGLLGKSKLNHRLLSAWLASKLVNDKKCILIFVGENDAGEYGLQLEDVIANSRANSRIKITGWVDSATYKQYLNAADVGVQLRALSRGETSAAVLDCMNAGLPTIVNANGSMVSISDDAVWKLTDFFTDIELAELITNLYQNPEERLALGKRAQQIIRTQHAPSACADEYREAIENFYSASNSGIPALVKKVGELECELPTDDDVRKLAQNIDRSVLPSIRQRQLLIDISELVKRDAHSGIQRVVRSILQEWLFNPPDGFRVEPVYANEDSQGYRYARSFILNMMGCPSGVLADEPITYRAGDHFIGLDLQHFVVQAQQSYYRRMREAGVTVRFVVYDLLPIQWPNYFVEGALSLHERWLDVVTKQDGAICISKAVADELSSWLKYKNSARASYFSIDWFHLGADLASSVPTKGLPEQAISVLAKLKHRPSFLMVGTLEPRKGYTQVLDAFEQLWQSGVELNLVMVGKQGWMVDLLAERLRIHAEYNSRLFWLEGISDEYLERIYANSSCLIAASYGEGFGLPLIEAAQNKLPIIARDIPVFREVAGMHAFYFGSEDASDLANSIRQWLEQYEQGAHPLSENMPWLTWKESAQNLLAVVTGNVNENNYCTFG